MKVVITSVERSNFAPFGLARNTDLCSKMVVGWAMSFKMQDNLTLRALHMAIKQRNPKAGLIHHSD